MKIKRLGIVIAIFFCITPSIHLLIGEKLPIKQEEDQDYSVTVSLKLIQVFVTDKEGNPVLDLTKDDFVLYDNGQLKEITDFEKHILARQGIKTEPESTPQLSSRMNRKFLILLDIVGNDNVGVILSKEAAFHFIDTQVMPGDEVGVLSFTPIAGFTINTYFTSDHDKIKHAIENAKEVAETKWEGPTIEQLKAEAEADAVEKHSTSRQGSRGDAGEAGFGGESLTTSMFVRPFQERKRPKKDALSLLGTVMELAKTLKYIPGIKHIMYFSGGGPQKFHAYFERLGMELAGANCLVHTINAMGTRSHFQGWNRPSKETLEILSNASGGKYYEDVRDYEVMAADIQNLSSNYYVLGYYIDEKWDGRYHKIRIEVKKEGCHVYAQGGYFNPKPFSRFSEFEKKLHLIDLALSDNPYFQDPLDIPVITLPCSNSAPSNCVLLSELPVDYIEGNSGHKIELINIVLDDKKNIIDSSRGEWEYETLLDVGAYQYAILSLPPGQYECRVALRNLITGKGAAGLSQFTIPKEQESAIVLFSPLLLIPEQKSRFLKLVPEKSNPDKRDDVSLNHIYPFLSNRYSPLIHQLGKDTPHILAVLRYKTHDLQRHEIALHGTLIHNATAKEEPLDFHVVQSRKLDDATVLLISINLPPLEPGEHSIVFRAEDMGSSTQSQTVRSFTIK